MSWKGLEDIFTKCLEDVFKTSWRRFYKTSWRHFKEPWRDVLKTYDQNEYIGLDQDVLKTSSEDVCVRWIYSSWSRRRLISIDIEAIRTVFNLIFFSWRNFKHLKHKQKIIFNLNNIQSNIFINKKGIQVTFN